MLFRSVRLTVPDTVPENAGSVTITARRVGGAFSPITLYASLQQSNDFRVDFGDGETSKTFTYPVPNDTIKQGRPHDFSINFGVYNGYPYFVNVPIVGNRVTGSGNPGTLTISLLDDEAIRDYVHRLYTELFGRSEGDTDRKSTRLNSSHIQKSRMPSSA